MLDAFAFRQLQELLALLAAAIYFFGQFLFGFLRMLVNFRPKNIFWLMNAKVLILFSFLGDLVMNVNLNVYEVGIESGY